MFYDNNENKRKINMRIMSIVFDLFQEVDKIEKPLSCYKHKEKEHKKFLKELRWYLEGLHHVLEDLEGQTT